MKTWVKLGLAAAFVAASVAGAAANDFSAELKAFAEEKAKEWAKDPALVAAVKAQNEEHKTLDEAAIDALDKAWRAEVGASEQPTISSVLEKDASKRLAEIREASEGMLTEIFVMDDKGLNVAASDVTSDYFQGDEAKWQETFLKGADAIHYGDVELDDSTQTYQSQVSLTIVDPETGAAIGAITFGVNLEALE